MKFGSLADLFYGAGAKYLIEVEVNKLRSNQHEFQGVGSFRSFLGTPVDKKTFPATFLWLDDTDETETPRIEAFCTWSDVRLDNPDRGAEYHLYYAAESEPVVHLTSSKTLPRALRVCIDQTLDMQAAEQSQTHLTLRRMSAEMSHCPKGAPSASTI